MMTTFNDNNNDNNNELMTPVPETVLLEDSYNLTSGVIHLTINNFLFKFMHLAFIQSDLYCIQSGHLVHAFSGNPITLGVSIAACSII